MPAWPSAEALARASEGDPEAQCKVGWIYYADGSYTEAAKWLRKAADQGNHNSMGAAGRLFVEGRGVPRDLKRGMRYLRQGAECPNIGGNESCAPDLAAIFEEGKLVPRNDEQAYYSLGLCIAKCVDDGGLERRPEFVARQRAVGLRLEGARKRMLDQRLRRWLDPQKASGCGSLGELDGGDTPRVSVYFEDETSVGLTVSTGPATLVRFFEFPLAQLGDRLRDLAVSDSASIRIYSYYELSPELRAKVQRALANGNVRYSRLAFVSARPKKQRLHA